MVKCIKLNLYNIHEQLGIKVSLVHIETRVIEWKIYMSLSVYAFCMTS